MVRSSAGSGKGTLGGTVGGRGGRMNDGTTRLGSGSTREYGGVQHPVTAGSGFIPAALKYEHAIICGEHKNVG